MSNTTITTNVMRSGSVVVALIDGSASARQRRFPADLRTAVTQDEIRAADARYRAEVTSKCDRAYGAAYTAFESGAIDNAEYRRRCRTAKAELDRRMI